MAPRALGLCVGILGTEVKQVMETFLYCYVIYTLKGKPLQCSCFDNKNNKQGTELPWARQRTGLITWGISFSLLKSTARHADGTILSRCNTWSLRKVVWPKVIHPCQGQTDNYFLLVSNGSCRICHMVLTVFCKYSNSFDLILHFICSFEQNTHLQ